MRSNSIILLVLSSFIMTLPIGAQESVDAAINAKIREEGLNHSQVLKTFSHFTEVIGPRLTGGPAVKAAEDYAVALLRGWGLTDARLEAWDFGRGWMLAKSTFEMVEPRYMPLIGYPEAWSASTPGEIVA